MKKLAIMLFVVVNCSLAYAQDDYFGKGTKVFDINVGLGSPYWSSGLKNSLPINPRIGLEVGITDEISIGGSVAYSGAKYDYDDGFYKYSIRYNAYFIGARGAYHFATSEKLDPYAGASLGYVVVSVNGTSSAYSVGSGAGYGGFVGIRYYPKSKLGLNAELGYSSFSFLNVGASFKF